MNTNLFSVGSPRPLLRGFRLLYSVSGEPLGEAEVIQLVVRLPFCLYIPPCRYVFRYPRTGELIGFVPEKVWTDRAEGSTDIRDEFIIPDKTVYLTNPEIITDWIGTPGSPAEGIKGHNVEFAKDPTGYFRFTRLTTELDWKVPAGFDPYKKDDDNEEKAIEELSSRTLDTVNYVIDLYRVVTSDGYIERVSHLILEDIRIGIPDNCSIRKQQKFTGEKFTYKCGYHPYLFSAHGIRPAIVNKPGEIIDAFRSSLEDGLLPETHKLLKLNAQAALDRRDGKMAVIESFTSLEVYVEQFYHRKLSNRMTADEIENLLTYRDNWRLKVRLKALLKQCFSRSIADMDNNLWRDWLKAHDKRSDLIHHNIEPSLEEAKNIVRLNEAVLRLLESSV